MEALNDILSKPQLNHNSTQPNITLRWVRHENDFAYHPILNPNIETNIEPNIETIIEPEYQSQYWTQYWT